MIEVTVCNDGSVYMDSDGGQVALEAALVVLWKEREHILTGGTAGETAHAEYVEALLEEG